MAQRRLFLLSALLAGVRGEYASTPAPTGYPTAAVYSTTSAPSPFGPSGYLDPSFGPSSALYTSAGYGTTSTPGTSPTMFTTAGLFNTPQILSSSYPSASQTKKTTMSSSSSENTPLPLATSSKGEHQISNQGYSNSPSLSSYAEHEPTYNPPCNPSSHLLPPSRNPFIPSLYSPNLDQAINQFIPRYNANPNSFNPFSIFPYYQQPHNQVPNPLEFLNNFAPPSSFHAMVHTPVFRGPVPSPGYYSPNHPPPHYTQSYPRYPVPSRNYLPYNHR